MSEYSDLGTYIMKLFDPLIAESKEQMNEAQKNFIRDIPRKAATRMSISIPRAEDFVREMSEMLIRINQELLHKNSVSIAKKVRSEDKKRAQSSEDFKQIITKKDRDIEGLQAQIQTLEQRARTLESEKDETLKQLTNMVNTIKELENRLANVEEEYSYQISQLNLEWEKKFQENQEEWDSYVKLKLAEQEVHTASKTEPEPDSENHKESE
jgi:DNA repair exonuclease SbcCD ATPase subunit